MLKITLFGSPQINDHARGLTNKVAGRVFALFGYLLLNEGPQSRSHLADLLWSELSEKQAKSNLRYVLYELRKVLGKYLIVTRQAVAFNQNAPQWVDVNVFSLFMATEFSAAQPQIIHEVLKLYQGELLAGLHIQDAPSFERWLEDERRHFREQVIQAWLYLCENASDSGEYNFGIMAGRELLKLDPGCESAHRLVMKQLAYTDQRTAALAQFALCQEALEREYAVSPDEMTVALFYQIQSGELMAPTLANAHQNSAHQGSALGEMGAPVHADQPPLSPDQPERPSINWELVPHCRHFVGREAELAKLRNWVEQERYQVVGIFGLPGMGKSALAAELVTGVVEGGNTKQHSSLEPVLFEHIIWHSASRFSTLLELLQTWCSALDSANNPPTSIEICLQLLLSHLRNQRVLFVLDDIQSTLALHDNAAFLDAAISTEHEEIYQAGWT